MINVSVIIPCYNADTWIGDALNTCFQQTYQSIEIIVVDDGSTDKSSETADAYLKNCHFQHAILSISNSGPSRARNLGWQKASGQWIQFLDADDLLHVEKIARQMTKALEVDCDVAVLYSPWQRLAMVNGMWQPVFEVVSPVIGQDPLVDLLKSENFLQLGSVLFRRSWLERVGGFDERYRLIEDVHLLLRIAMAGGQFHKVDSPDPLFYYRQVHGTSLSQRDQRAFIEGCLRNAALAEDYWRSQGDLTPAQTETLIGVYFQGARFFAAVDHLRFAQLAAKLESFHAPFIPAGPAHLRLASQLLGYSRAEKLATQYRRLKKAFH